jgi:FkbM family methyltransferase
VSGSIVKYGNWEGNHIDLIVDLLKQDPELQFIDIGTNVGAFALSVALFGRRVLAVDALAMNIQRLCSSVIVGNFSNRIKIVYNALSDVHEMVSLGMDNNNVGGTFVAKDRNSNKARGSHIVGNYGTVQAITLNDILSLPNFDFKKVVFKIDVEGYENKVFKGAEQFFDNVNVQAVLMEWMWLKTGSAGQEILDFMLRKNMEPHVPNKLPNPLPIGGRANWPNDVLWRKKR